MRGRDGQVRRALVRVHSSGTRLKTAATTIKEFVSTAVRCHNYQENSEADDSAIETLKPVRRSRAAACLQASDSDLD